MPSSPRIIARLMRVLLVKTSSLGDVIHNLPLVTDLRTRFPEAAIDWVVEEGFAEIVRLHPAIRRVIPVALRRWRRAPLVPATCREMFAFRVLLRQEYYNLVIDSQGLLKSALITRAARGKRCGYSASTAREPLAARFYDLGFDVSKDLHAVERNRRLGAQAAGYTFEPATDYGIAVSPAPTPAVAQAMLLTATSRDDKLWPQERWIALGQTLHERGVACWLPAGSEIERQRAQQLAQAIPGARVLPPSGLTELARHLAAARMVIGVDTGLVHLAAALGRPTVALFCASDPERTGVLARTPAVNLGAPGRPPSVDEVLGAVTPWLR